MAAESPPDRGRLRRALLTGVAVVVPSVITLAFVTSETPEAVAGPTESGEMRTLFMPMAPNPVMGGHVLFVPERRIVEVDLTGGEGIRALVTSGVALERAAADAEGVSPSQVRDAGGGGRGGERIAPDGPAAPDSPGDGP